jgi:hypothetical protein
MIVLLSALARSWTSITLFGLEGKAISASAAGDRDRVGRKPQ